MKQKKTISMMASLFLIALVPTLAAAVIVAVSGCKSLSDSLENDVYHELLVAAQGLANYYEQDIRNVADHQPSYDHDYVDSPLKDDVQLTLFMQDVRFVTSVEDKSNATGRNEGTN